MPRDAARLLLVEDDPELLDLMTRWLQRHGINVCAVAAYEAATAEAHAQEFDVAVVDGNLRGRDGIELIDKLHQIQSKLPVVVVSGRDDEQMREQCRRAGAMEHLVKPVSLAVLHGVIIRLMPSEQIRTSRGPNPHSMAHSQAQQ